MCKLCGRSECSAERKTLIEQMNEAKEQEDAVFDLVLEAHKQTKKVEARGSDSTWLQEVLEEGLPLELAYEQHYFLAALGLVLEMTLHNVSPGFLDMLRTMMDRKLLVLTSIAVVRQKERIINEMKRIDGVQ